MAKFPPRNLPGSANEWGRRVEELLQSVTNTAESSKSKLENVSRSTAGMQQATATATDAANTAQQIIEADVFPAIDAAAISPVTDDRLSESSLSIWPFVNSTIPRGALEPGAVEQNDIADFAISVKKLNSLRHHLY